MNKSEKVLSVTLFRSEATTAVEMGVTKSG